MSTVLMSEDKFWTMRGECSVHGHYAYQCLKTEESVGCPVCTVRGLETEIQKLREELKVENKRAVEFFFKYHKKISQLQELRYKIEEIVGLCREYEKY